jgi:hypothetical protein
VAVLWEIERGERRGVLRGHTDTVTAVDFGPHEQFVITGSLDGTARLWNAGTCEQINRHTCHRAGVVAARFVSHGRRALTAGIDGGIRLWAVPSWQPCGELTGSTARVTALSFDPSQRLLLCGDLDRRVRIWSIRDSTLLGTHRLPGKPLCASPLGQTELRLVLTGGKASAHSIQWDLISEEQALLELQRLLTDGKSSALWPELKRDASFDLWLDLLEDLDLRWSEEQVGRDAGQRMAGVRARVLEELARSAGSSPAGPTLDPVVAWGQPLFRAELVDPALAAALSHRLQPTDC